ncbi:hypothetical protein BaRGS_00005416 [Batillaria attramentaria]|uniref:RRM domain-containing protein n=1 Tax=Batillaria attramentaria TaxID=370345 RepID=A0ABD0LV06_9CAEN
MTIKIFIGNLNSDTKPEDIRVLFEKYGSVTECDVLKNYGFVHMTDKAAADEAIANLDGYSVRGQNMRVELSTGKRGNPKGDRRGPPGGRPRPYSGPPRDRGALLPSAYDRYDPYYRYAYERDPYFRPLPPVDRYLPPRGLADRYAPLPPRERFLPEERRPYPPDPRDRLMPPRERLPLYPEERAAYDRLRVAERAPLAADPYYRERSPPPARPPPEYYDRKAPLVGRSPLPAADPASARLNTTAYPSSNGYDYYRQPAERADYRAAAPAASDYYAVPRGGASAYDRVPTTTQASSGGVGYAMQQQQSRAYDSQTALQTKPIFF